MPKGRGFSLRSKSSTSADEPKSTERKTYTIVSHPTVVVTRNSDGKVIAPGSSSQTTTTSGHHYGTMKTTQMTVVETRVTSNRAEASSSSSASGATSSTTTTTSETSQTQSELNQSTLQASEQLQIAGLAKSVQETTGPPKPAVRKKILNQATVVPTDQVGGLMGTLARAINDGARVRQAESELSLGAQLVRVPADYSAPSQLPAAQTIASGRPPSTGTKTTSQDPSQGPNEMTAINPTVNGNHQRQQQVSKGNPLTTAFTEVSPTNGGLSTTSDAKIVPTPIDGGGEDGESSGDEPRKSYPKKVLFIVANEFCERFSYYGLRTVLVLYFRSVLGFSDSGSTVSFHLFATLCYLTPILGAILGDSILGKYKTILYLSIVYFLGELLLVFASVFWDLGTWSIVLTWMALILIGVGTGGIKPCVSAFGGDQFRPSETAWREGFFSLFYGAINLGSLISMFITPMLRAQNSCVGRSDCYPLAFLVPCALMFVSIVVFLLASKYYYHAPLPEKNVILAFCQCTWLALKRKLSGHKLPIGGRRGAADSGQLLGHTNPSLSDSGSNISVNETTPVVTSSKQVAGPPSSSERANGQTTNAGRPAEQVSARRNHWLYLAADRFDTNSIEEFRCVLGIFLLFAPTPVFWALFDQQGSLWTLQATRMDGHILGSRFVLEPDQMMVANPLLLLASIPLFQFVIYPTFNRCNILTTPIQRMTAGGLLAALTFVASGLIEFKIQQMQPLEVPRAGQANLILINGLNDCSLVEPRILPTNQLGGLGPGSSAAPSTSTTLAPVQIASIQTELSAALQPLGSQLFEIMAQESAAYVSTGSLPVSTANQNQPQAGYALSFRLASSLLTGETPYTSLLMESSFNSTTIGGASIAQAQPQGCPLDSSQTNELLISSPVPAQAVRMLYVDQGNGKVSHKIFNETLELPPAGKARVRLLYEFFGSWSQAQKRQFRLVRDSATEREKANSVVGFTMSTRDGQVLLSDHLDVEVPTRGAAFSLVILDEKNQPMPSPSQQRRIYLEPGTRNLLVLHQIDAKSHKLRQELLQDNNYRISILYQLVPYLMISFAEVLFSITGLEFSYAMAPPDLKSLILGAWTLTTAFGNMLTVAIESAHPFANIGYDFLLYAAIMALDMIVFAIIGYHYEPYEPAMASQSMSSRKKIN